jgi:hypothetical protein
LFGGNIRSDQRSADRPPGKRPFGEKKSLRVVFLAFAPLIDPLAVGTDDEQIEEKYDVVFADECVVHGRAIGFLMKGSL